VCVCVCVCVCAYILSRVGVTYKMGFGLDDWIYCTLYAVYRKVPADGSRKCVCVCVCVCVHIYRHT
jgi:hypothetical protein